MTPLPTLHRLSDGRMIERVRIRFAADCSECPDCGELWCGECSAHYADCECVGPSNAEDAGWSLVERQGVLYGERPSLDYPPGGCILCGQTDANCRCGTGT